MLTQIAVIAWAQFRSMRNHLPRTPVGTVLVSLVSLVWYGVYAALAVFLALALPHVPLAAISRWLPAALLGVFLFWQLLPLFTMSSGWSLQLDKLRSFPISNAALFWIETLLRFTTAPEMILVLLGGAAGLARHPQIQAGYAFCLLLYIPFNLFLSLGIREICLHAFERNWKRELLAVVFIAIAVIPQILARTGWWRRGQPYFLAAANGIATPWHETAVLSLGANLWRALALLAVWTAAAFAFARWQFQRGLARDEIAPTGAHAAEEPAAAQSGSRLGFVNSLFRDPVAAILQKEFQSLVRMPRFRVMFGMACIFGLLVFFPASMAGPHHNHSSFMRGNFLVVVDLYGLLLLSDVLLLNVFGFDRAAAQMYFASPVPLRDVLRAKNVTAAVFVGLQGVVVLALAAILRVGLSPSRIGEAEGAVAVATVFFLAVGNLCSVEMPRPIDARQTFRKQAGGRMQIWFFLCAIGLGILMGFAFLARWAFDSDWALGGVFAIEFAIGVIFYCIATNSAIERAQARREKILEALMKGSSPVALGT